MVAITLAGYESVHVARGTGKGCEPGVLATATVTAPNGTAFRVGSTHLEAYNKESRLLQVNEISCIAGAIDFIAFRPRNKFVILAHEVVQNMEDSDHMPVVTELKLQ